MSDFNGKNNGYHDASGRFRAGNPGRRPGATNKVRASIKAFVDSKLSDLPKWFDGLESDRERLDALVRLLPYCVPRLQAQVDSEGQDIQPEGKVDLSVLNELELEQLAAIQSKLFGWQN